MYLKQRCNSKARVFPFTLVVSHPHHIYASTGSIGFVEMSGATRLRTVFVNAGRCSLARDSEEKSHYNLVGLDQRSFWILVSHFQERSHSSSSASS